MRKCPKCGKKKSLSQYYIRTDRNAPQSYCKECLIRAQHLQQAKLKREAIEYMGGKCAKCGYNKSMAALCFHHLDPKQKEIIISKLRSCSLERIKKELKKCIMLCLNCHAEEHATDTWK